ncbi:MAG: outer membrane protein assembly factor [Pirellulaceae bacterium]
MLDYSYGPLGKRGLAVVLMCVVYFGVSPVCGQSPLPGGMPNAAENEMVAEVHITGNETVGTEEILRHLRTRKDRRFDPEVLQADKRRLMTKGKLRDVRIYTQRLNEGVVVTFEVFERPTIRYIRFIGNRGVGEKPLLKESGLELGDAINAYSIEEGRRRIEEFYHTRGYPNAQVVVAEGKSAEDSGAVFYISEGALQRVARVEFVGNTIATDARLKTKIQSKPGLLWYLFRGKVDEEKISRDTDILTEYYRGLGFFRARVSRMREFDDSGKWLTLTFVIDEGPRYVVRNVSVMGSKQFAAEELEQRLDLKQGEYFNLTQMNADVSSLRDAFGMHGFIFADIRADPRFLEEPGQLDLVYSIDEGNQFRVGEINVHIAGEFPHTQESVILDRLSLRPGDIVDIRKVRASERRLKASQLFVVNPSEGSPPRIVIKPPDLSEMETLASRRGGRSVRGQSPEAEASQSGIRKIDMDVYVTPALP